MSKLTDSIASFDKVVENYNNELKSFQDKMEKLLKENFSEFFTKTKITWVGWCQYTPYFNDGDPCVFSVHEIYYGYESDPSTVYSPYDGLYVRYGDGVWHRDDIEEKTDTIVEGLTEEDVINDYNVVKLFIETVSKIPDDVFEGMFGDHVFVKATAEGIEVEEYDHD